MDKTKATKAWKWLRSQGSWLRRYRLIIVAGWFIFLLYRCGRSELRFMLQEPELNKYRNMYNQEVAEKGHLQVSFQQLKKASKSDKETIRRLANEINSRTVAAVSANIVTKFTGGATLMVNDTIYIDTITRPTGKIIDTQYYDRETQFRNEWIDLMIWSSQDTARIDLSVWNKLDVNFTSKRNGLLGLGKKQSFVRITNLNPYTTTTEMNSYAIPSKKRIRLRPGLHVGYDIISRKPGIVISAGFNVNYW